MNILTLLIDVLLTVPLSLVLVKIERKKDNFIYSCLIPAIYIIIIAALLPNLKKNIFLIPIFELFIRNFYITNVNEELHNSKKTILSSLISIGLVIFTYNYFISKVNNVLPTPEEIRPILWFLIIYIIYSIFKDANIKNESKIKTIAGKKEYIMMQYAKYKSRYENVINSKNKTINLLIYSLIIYKSYQQPKLFKDINNYVKHLLNKEVKYGILDVSSPTPLSDEESISIVLKELEPIARKQKDKSNLSPLLTNYTEEEQKEIEYIYRTIDTF